MSAPESRPCRRRNRRTRPLSERFEEKVDRTPGQGPNGDCWLWTGYVAPHGYGQIGKGRSDEGQVRVHRYALEQALGRPLRDGMDSCHTCDVRHCVNPAHLFEGTRAENLEDMTRKGRRRSRPPKGTASPHAKLDDEAVREIRGSIATQRRLAARFGVSRNCIRMVQARKSWKHVV